VADQLIPVEQQHWYGRRVNSAGSGHLLRQAYLNGTGHCAFRPAETIAALHAIESRITTGAWTGATDPARLNAAAGTGRYVAFTAPRLTGGIGEPGRR
jgi:hypothetical protein